MKAVKYSVSKEVAGFLLKEVYKTGRIKKYTTEEKQEIKQLEKIKNDSK